MKGRSAETYLERVLWQINPEWFTTESNRKHAKYINDAIRFMAKREKRNYLTLLDAPCGIGRLDGRLRRYGYQVIGLDNNSYFISEAKRRDSAHAADYIKADMRSFHLKKRFDVILQWCASFGYYDDAGNLAMLKSFSRHLNKGGLLFLDFPSKKWRLRHTDSNAWYAEDFATAVKLSNTEIVRKANATYMVFTIKVYKKKGKDLVLCRRSRLPVKLYTQKEMLTLLKKAGFVMKYAFSSRTFQKITDSDRRSILLCVKEN
jgi:SAM-dependent methyltransferase